ncbi:PilZ domain-containing protein [Gracilibacillus kekensis]|uniref:PilZ domain-containing protein n=1 Tax=Gracilibacillus kekensis TaxID=1027249 RepID=A0A1M7ME38_9BACI|nr:PilZ domain-containing protein [Gracilibacillus kekensis]SHM89020.1 PilZ domain-containing protein [Gracilibacillus kekensis]
MHYKRNEAFRYQFKEKITAEITIDRLYTIEIILIDVSPKGMRFSSTKKIPIDSNICIEYKIVHEKLQINGFIVWQIDYGTFYQYGASLEDNKIYQKQLINELKKLAKTKPQ